MSAVMSFFKKPFIRKYANYIVVALIALSPVVAKLCKEYFDSVKK